MNTPIPSNSPTVNEVPEVPSSTEPTVSSLEQPLKREITKSHKFLIILSLVAMFIVVVAIPPFFIFRSPTNNNQHTNESTNPPKSEIEAYDWFTLTHSSNLVTFSSEKFNVSFDFPSNWTINEVITDSDLTNRVSIVRADGRGVEFAVSYVGGDCDPQLNYTEILRLEKPTHIPGLNVVSIHRIVDMPWIIRGRHLFVSSLDVFEEPVYSCLDAMNAHFIDLGPDFSRTAWFIATRDVTLESPNLDEIIDVLASFRLN